jgi:uncharacterized membrane protein
MLLPLHAALALWDVGLGLALPLTAMMGAVLALARGEASLPRPQGTAPPVSTTVAVGDQSGASLFTAILLGIGIAGFIDESIFHQVLQWHNFYWDTSPEGRILSDGLFHIGSTLILLWGAFRLWRGARPHAQVLLAGILLGAGGFNAYDGIVQHIILHFHLVNEYVCPTPLSGDNSVFNCPQDIPYEIAWIAVASLLFGSGLVLWLRRPGRE